MWKGFKVVQNLLTSYQIVSVSMNDRTIFLSALNLTYINNLCI